MVESQELSISTNGGSMVTRKTATVPHIGESWFNERALTNVLSLALVSDKYQVTMDTHAEDAMIIHFPQGPIKFQRHPFTNLYFYKPPSKPTRDRRQRIIPLQLLPPASSPIIMVQTANFVETVDSNARFYTKRQFERAKLARQLLHVLGCPSIRDMKTILQQNAIRNCPVTIEDVDIAQRIFGKDIASLKGKTTRAKPTPVRSDIIAIPKELVARQRRVELCIDTLYQMPFLSTISRNLMYRTIQWVPTQTVKDYRSALEQVFRIYNVAGFKVVTIHCDREYKALLPSLQDKYQIKMNHASAQEHIPEAERNNRTLKERFRASIHYLPYRSMPRIMIKILAMEVARKLNLFPPKGGVSDRYSPRVIMHQEPLSYSSHCRVPFGSYIQAHDDYSPKNTPKSRTIDGVYLRPASNQEVMNSSISTPSESLPVDMLQLSPLHPTSYMPWKQQQKLTAYLVSTSAPKQE